MRPIYPASLRISSRLLRRGGGTATGAVCVLRRLDAPAAPARPDAVDRGHSPPRRVVERRLVDDGERRPEQRLDATHVAHQLLLLGDRVAHHLARLGVRLGHDHVGLAAGGLLEVLGGTLGRDEGRAEQALELDVARDLGLELLDALDELRALAPDGLEAVGDVVHHPMDGRLPIAEQAALELDVPDLDGCECHDDSLLLQQAPDQLVQQAPDDDRAR